MKVWWIRVCYILYRKEVFCVNSEQWKAVVGYEGYYEISNLGQVRSVDRKVKWNGTLRAIRGRRAKMLETQDGYKKVRLCKDGIRKEYFIHRLVYEAFIGKIDADKEINHKDFDRSNNSVDNLEALTHKQNVQYTVLANRHYASRDLSGSNNPNYGNRKLSKRYSSDKALCIEKQSRPGAKNGRCVPVIATDINGVAKEFAYILECADYIKNKNSITSAISTIALKISNSLKSGATCYGYTITSA